jgi:hypothetical protein
LALREQEFHDRYTVKSGTKSTASDRLRSLVEAMLHHYDWGLWMEFSVLSLRDRGAAAERDRMDRRWRAALRNVIRDGQARGEFAASDPDETMFILAALLDGWAPLLAVKAKGVSQERVEKAWLAEARRLLGPGFDDRPLKRTR